MWIVTTLGLGRLRPAPGTWGSLPPCVLAFGMLLAGASPQMINWTLLAIAVAGAWSCVALGGWVEEHTGVKDPGLVVVDETMGMAVALILVDLTPLGRDSALAAAVVLVAAFLLFRIFDIIKIPPANLMQQFPRGWGIVLDDLVAGIAANVFLQVVLALVLPLLIGVVPGEGA